MTGILVLEQALNGLQFGLMLFLLAAGLTLVFGIMDMINLAHGSLYMVGAYLVAAATAAGTATEGFERRTVEIRGRSEPLEVVVLRSGDSQAAAA